VAITGVHYAAGGFDDGEVEQLVDLCPMVNLPLLLPTFLLGFLALWAIIGKLIALFGWRRLANHYQVDHLPAGPRQWLSLVYVGPIKYQNVIYAQASAEGLGLSVLFLFRIGHPPLLIPWQAIGPVQYKKGWFTTSYSISIRTSDTSSIQLKFESKSFLTTLQPWLTSHALSMPS
jgi:hypothetical protein